MEDKILFAHITNPRFSDVKAAAIQEIEKRLVADAEKTAEQNYWVAQFAWANKLQTPAPGVYCCDEIARFLSLDCNRRTWRDACEISRGLKYLRGDRPAYAVSTIQQNLCQMSGWSINNSRGRGYQIREERLKAYDNVLVENSKPRFPTSEKVLEIMGFEEFKKFNLALQEGIIKAMGNCHC